MQIEQYYSVTGDGRLIILNGAFTCEELRDILDEAAQYPRIEAEIDDDDLLA